MPRPRALVAALAAILLAPTLGTVAGAAPSTPPSTGGAVATSSAEAPTTGLLRIRVDTTSPWTTVTFSGRLGGIRVHALSGAGQVSRLPNGFTMSGVGSAGATITFDAVLEDPRSGNPWVSTEKGYTGATRVRLENRTGTPFQALDVVNKVRSTTDPTNRKLFSVARGELFGPSSLELPGVTTDPLVLAFYHPWFNESVYGDPTLADRPSDRTDSWDPADVLAMTAQAQGAGIDGFVVSWAGAANDRHGFAKVIQAAHARGAVTAGLLEAVSANAGRDASKPADPAVAEAWLRELLLFSLHPSYLTHEGVPVVFVYEMRRLAPAVWRDILGRLAADGIRVRLVSDAGRAWSSVSWGDFTYNPWGDDQGFRTMEGVATATEATAFEARSYAATNPGAGARLVTGTAFPGYDDRLLRGFTRPFVERDGTRTYEASWAAAEPAAPDWMLITSWNEWWEGTSIQPSDRYGTAALDATGPLVTAFKSAAVGR